MKNLHISFFPFFLSFAINAQVLVNQAWVTTTGAPDITNFPYSQWDQIDWSASTVDNSGNLIVIGNTLVAPGNTDVLVTKYNASGSIIWQQTYDGPVSSYDYGVALTTDLSGNVYAAALTSSFGSTLITTLKYTSSGTLVWQQSWQGSGSLYQSPSAIALDNSGNVIVAGGTFSLNTQSDMAVLKYDNNGNLLWNKGYDYAGFYEVPVSIKILPGDHISVSGFSASAANTWDFADIHFDKTTGTILASNRTALPDINIDEAFDVAWDDNSNIYIAGTSGGGTHTDFEIIKIDSNYDMEWDKQFDGRGLDDKPKSMAIDSEGNVIVAGNSNTPQGSTEILTIKISPLGEEEWRNTYTSSDNLGYTKTVKLIVSENDEAFIAGTINHEGNLDYTVFMYDENGSTRLERIYDHGNGSKDKPTDLIITGNDIFITGTTETTDIKYTTVKYEIARKEIQPVIINNEPSHNDREVIVKIHSEYVIESFVNDRKKRFGTLDDALTPDVVSQIVQKLGLEERKDEVCVVKIYHRMTTTDSTSLTRLGRTIKIPKFWCTFLFVLPESFDEVSAMDTLNTLPAYVEFADLNHLRVLHNIPDDTYFLSHQAGLFPSATYPDAHINVEPAWDLQVGNTNVKVSANDSPIFWAHEDFGNGTFAGSKIVGGWDFKNDVSIPASTAGNHGTSVAGIMGALRNNTTGVAGIAGGDGSGNTGAQLFSLGLASPGDDYVTVDVIAAAVVEGAVFNPDTGFGYGLNIQNNSYGGGPWNTAERNAVKVCFENECSFVASRGNNVGFDLNYPACYNDDWELNVGANNIFGNWQEGTEGGMSTFESGQGGDIDVIAPGVFELVLTPVIPFASAGGCASTTNYLCFEGTSAAAPHVAGLAALMYAEHHVDNGQWNNLAPDDIEHIIQVTATDVNAADYDDQSGFGRINADASIRPVHGPEWRVFHSGEPSSRTLSTAVNQEIIVPLGTENIPAGTYYGERITIVDSYLDIFPDYIIVDWWDRLSGTTGISAANPSVGNPWGNFTYTINGGVAAVTVTTYTYHFTTSPTGQSVDLWYPRHTDDVETAYSLHLRASTTGTNEILTDEGISVFPNPVTDKVTIQLHDELDEFRYIQLFENSGKILKNINAPEVGLYQLDMSDLAAGIYLCKVVTAKAVIPKFIVKQ